MSGGVCVHGLDFELGESIRNSDSGRGMNGSMAEGSGPGLAPGSALGHWLGFNPQFGLGNRSEWWRGRVLGFAFGPVLGRGLGCNPKF